MADSRLAGPAATEADPNAHRVPGAPASSEFKDRGSRFLAFLAPCANEEDFGLFLASLKKRFHDATHHCWAYRLGWGADLRERCGDDGEPSRTAGPPILSALQRAGVTDAALVVVRYFGGVKLGTSGLVRAYREAADAVVGAAVLEGRTLASSYEVEMPYSAQGTFRHALARLGLEVGGERFGASWGATVSVPLARAGAFEETLAGLREAHRGEVRWKSK